ncbi:hypothetical protein EG68_03795 [Paragonimus skrjabini miyazakii]|uniref:TLC domain-containing protein n=1 Tax=Paragonimus skrjabini miyazakii TaxID=59628 RepID=A0A8S9YVB6_9TREM|nr:hypothetical protein EG68_03795 [Paragonimus skrjabini miyazakii]
MFLLVAGWPVTRPDRSQPIQPSMSDNHRVVNNANSGLILALVSFVIFRLMLSTGLYIWAILHRSVLPKLVSSVLLTSFTIFTAMNFVLFWRVLASEKRILESHQLKTSKDKCTIGIHQVNGRLPEIGSF